MLNTGTWVMLKVAVRKTSGNQLLQGRVKDAIQGHWITWKDAIRWVKWSPWATNGTLLQMSWIFNLIKNSSSEMSLSLRDCRVKAHYPKETLWNQYIKAKVYRRQSDNQFCRLRLFLYHRRVRSQLQFYIKLNEKMFIINQKPYLWPITFTCAVK